MGPFLAITRTTILMLMRKRAPLLLVGLVLCGAPLLGYAVLEGDNTIAGLMRLTISYNLAVFSGALMALTLYAASTVLDTEFTEQQIYLLDVKPVPRWVVLAGKCAGVLLVNAWLLLLAGVILYGVLMKLASPAKASGDQLEAAYQQILVSRQSFRPELPNIRQEVQRERDRLTREGKIDITDWDPARLEQAIASELNQKLLPVPFQGNRVFKFTGLPTVNPDNRELTVRYKLYGDRAGESAEWLQVMFLIKSPSAVTGYQAPLVAKRGATREFTLPATVVGSGGDLEITLYNLTGPEGDKPAAKIVVPMADGLEILAPSGAFGWNLARGLVLLWLRLAMLAVIGVSSNTFLRGRVAAFLVFGLIMAGTVHATVRSAILPRKTMLQTVAKDSAEENLRHVGGLVLDILPDFTDTDPVEPLSIGRRIPLTTLLERGFKDLLLRGGAFFLIGMFMFRLREVGLPFY